MTYNVFGGTLNPAQSNPIQKKVTILTFSMSLSISIASVSTFY